MPRARAPLSYDIGLVVQDPGAPPHPRPVSTSSGISPSHTDRETETALLPVRGRRPLEEKADASVLYLHPAGKKVLRLYAVERGVKVHDLLLEAIEEWAERHGLQGPWKVPSAGPPRRQRT